MVLSWIPPAIYRNPISKKNNIQILPISIRLGDELLVDKRDEQATRRFYQEQLDSEGIHAESIPYSVDQIQAVFLEQLVIDYDLVFCITVSGKRSLILITPPRPLSRFSSSTRKCVPTPACPARSRCG